LISYTAEALVSGYCPNERVYWISSAPTALRRLFAGQMLARACGSRIAHQRLRSRNSRHLQCCPFWRPRGIPAARPAPGVPCGGWLVAGYRIRYKGKSFETTKVDWWFTGNLFFCKSDRNKTWQRPAIRLRGRGPLLIHAAYLGNKAVIFSAVPL
jgi:hypothetical protein